jgi:hypothetical protein
MTEGSYMRARKLSTEVEEIETLRVLGVDAGPSRPARHLSGIDAERIGQAAQ